MDCSSCFSAEVFEDFLHFWGIATSRLTPYHPTGNSQNEHWNQTIWRTIELILHNRRLSEEAWDVLQKVYIPPVCCNEFDISQQIFSVSLQVDARKIYTEVASEPRTCFSLLFCEK